ncbi:3-oxoacyl-[acyl-carrier protein] reductase [Arthrobacter pigmenti]|uniref:3-oxoacyl-[acyl-carrier protein] reductase n=1 Tax=Arthrobacter pigmenti TaxID=271432 RepID=A0A846RV29_9MICC|nr:SDR family oxidoreductase [Arthrobacter pigmenti]NJC24017.1 3-oxoacyl-[acyl-carrier protein] reductase [Arthrobacter pigmenti]
MSRTILVTGGSNGIGRAIAQQFVEAGDRVIITGRTSNRLRATAESLGCEHIRSDAGNPDDVAALFDELNGHVDVLVNNAGGFAPRPTNEEENPINATASQWMENLRLNLLSAVLMTTACQPRLRPGSAVIHLGSIGAEYAGNAYSTAKAALAAWNAGLSAQLGPNGITTNVIAAGYIEDTDLFHGGMRDERRAKLIAATHDKRAGDAADIAATAFFLASPGARHITGQTIHVNGGAHTTR